MISGTLFGHNCFEFDYCVEAALDSLLAVCSQVVFGECASTDTTAAWIAQRAAQDPRIKVVTLPWQPTRMGTWLAALTDALREHCAYPYRLHLQADEVLLCSLSRSELDRIAQERHPLHMDRLNFWQDTKHTAPVGTICSSRILRACPSVNPSYGDGESLRGDPARVRYEPRLKIFHYGFIRRLPALVRKAIVMEDNFFNTHNPIWDQLAADQNADLLHRCHADSPSYDGPHPVHAHAWLLERGYSL